MPLVRRWRQRIGVSWILSRRLITFFSFERLDLEIDQIIPKLLETERKRCVNSDRCRINARELLHFLRRRLERVDLVRERGLVAIFQPTG